MNKEESKYGQATGGQAERNPLNIYCASCASPAEFDIVKQSYHCSYCGSDTDIGLSLEKMNQWRAQQRSAMNAEIPLGSANDECPNCTAKLVISPGEDTATCEYCLTKVVRRDAAAAAICECPNCGAKVVIDTGEAVDTCGFCSAKVVRRAFVTQDAFPEVIIPFFLTWEEAAGQLSVWAKRNSRKQKLSSPVWTNWPGIIFLISW